MGTGQRRGITLIEVLISLVLVAVLIALLVPMLVSARNTARTAVCSANLNQVGKAWHQYFNARGTFPTDLADADWEYGGAVQGEDGLVLAKSRPINEYMTSGRSEEEASAIESFRCPGDNGIFMVNQIGQRVSVIKGRSCFETFGTSYRSNRYLVDPALARGPNGSPTPLGLHEVQVWAERLLLAGDAEWYYATRAPNDPEATLEASWHIVADAGNMLALDGSVRFVRFRPGETSDYLLYHHPNRP